MALHLKWMHFLRNPLQLVYLLSGLSETIDAAGNSTLTNSNHVLIVPDRTENQCVKIKKRNQ